MDMNRNSELEVRLKVLFLELLGQNSDCIDSAEEQICEIWEKVIYERRLPEKRRPHLRLVTANFTESKFISSYP